MPLRVYIDIGGVWIVKVNTSAIFFHAKVSKMPNAQSINHDLGVRIQSLTLTKYLVLQRENTSKAVEKAKDHTGFSKPSIYRLRKQARQRGFDLTISPHLKLHYIEDADRPGRPTKITPQVEEALLAQVSKDRNHWEMTAAQHSYKLGISPSTTLKAFKKMKFRSCKTTKKPSLIAVMLRERFG